MQRLRKVFISHSHQDYVLADALRRCLAEIFSVVDVAFSSDKEAGGGPAAGANWVQWIHSRMLDCDEAILLLTPYSIQKPWPMWEAGAVAGIAMGQSKQGASPDGIPAKPVTPLYFKLPKNALPGPFVVTQSYDGTDKEGLSSFFGHLMRQHDFHAASPKVIDAVRLDQVAKFLENIAPWLRSAPAVVSEGTIVEWCERLDKLRKEKRSRNVSFLHRWIHLMYEGPDSSPADAAAWNRAAQEATWDIRLHLRLGENYEVSDQPKKAIEQYELAGKLAPLDVFVLHRLAKCYLEAKDPEGARKTLDRILELDKNALKWNDEIAGLEGRYWKDKGKASEAEGRLELARDSFTRARNAYQAVMDLAGDRVPFYLADNVGQLNLKIGDVEGARRAYERARAALEAVTSDNEDVWSLATRVTTALYFGSEDEALRYLVQIHDCRPSEEEQKSIAGGLDLLRGGLKASDARHRAWLTALKSGKLPTPETPVEANAVQR
jgi:tetratricopeptide (TPR) repeat protein